MASYTHLAWGTWRSTKDEPGQAPAGWRQGGETAAFKDLAAELRPIFESGHVHPEALAAILLFQQAAEAEQVTRALLDQVRALSVGCRSIYKSTKAGELKSMRRRRILL